MANPFDQFDEKEPNPFDKFDQQPKQQKKQTEPAKERGFFESAIDLFTGEQDITPEIESLQEIGNAPELNALSTGALKASFGLLTQGSDEGAAAVLKQNIPEAKFRKDSKGNVIADLPSGSYALNSPGLSGQDLARFLFGASAFTPAGAARTVGGAALGGAATELGIQAAGEALGGQEVDLGDVATAGALGGAFKGAESLISGISRVTRGRPADEAVETIAAGQSANVPVMTSDVIEPTTFAGKVARTTAEQTPLAGTGGLRASQQAARESAVENLTSQATPMYDDVISSLKRQQSKVKNAAGQRLGDIADQMDEVGMIPTEKSIKAIDDEIADLTAKGRVADDQTVSELIRYKAALEEGQTVKSLDTLRSDFRERVVGDRGASFPNRSQAAINKIYKSMTNDIRESIKNSLGDDALRRWNQAKVVYAQEAQKIKSTRLKQLFDKGDLTPENAKNLLLSQKPSEVKRLYQSLDQRGREAARSTVLSEALQKSLDAAGELSVDRFSTQLTKLDPQIKVLFKGQDRKQLEGFRKLMNATRQAQKADLTTPTGQQLIPFAAGAAAITDLTSTLGAGLTVGGLARIYESKPVRDALLRLANTKAGTTSFEKAVQAASESLSAGVQSSARLDKPQQDQQ